MKPFRLSARPSRALALLTGGALLAGLMTVPAATAVAEASDLPVPSNVTVDGQACGTEPVVVTLEQEDNGWLTFGATVDGPGVEGARVVLLDAEGTSRGSRFFPAGGGPVVAGMTAVQLTDNAVNTLVIRAEGADSSITGPAVECELLLHRAPDATLTVHPVLGAEAVYPGYEARRGGVGIPGAFVVLKPSSADVVSFAYGVSTRSNDLPTEWSTVPVAENVVIPFVPTRSGLQYLKVAEIDETGLIGSSTTRTINVAAPGAASEAPPAITISELADPDPGDGMVPLRLTLTEDLLAWRGAVTAGEVAVYRGSTMLARVAIGLRDTDVLVRQSELGTGYQDLRTEYVQFPGAETIVETDRVCGAGCPFTGGSVKVVSLISDGDHGDPSYNVYYGAEHSGFSPTPSTYTYQWLRDGAPISGQTDKDYLSSPADVGRRISLRVTAHGPRMEPRSVTSTSFTVRERAPMGLHSDVKAVGSAWEEHYCYCGGDNGDVVGWSSGKRSVEALFAFPSSTSYATRIAPPTETDAETYAALWFEMEGYVQGRGWEGLKEKDGNYYVGSVGQKRRLEAFRITPAGPHASFYDVWYRAYVPKYGWLGWARDGETAGTTGYGYPIQQVQLRILPKGTRVSASGTGNAASYDKGTQKQVTVQPHLSSSGWRSRVAGGSTAGLISTTQRLNALRVDVDGRYSGGVQVSAKVEGDGWRPYSGDGKVAGTYRANRTAAYRMKLTGGMASHYDVYYRVHVAGTGWLGWAKNGAAAGTLSYRYRNTAVQVVLVEKGERSPMSSQGRAAYKS
ncbi:hypothetical protein [Promicromonospora sukumoe]